MMMVQMLPESMQRRVMEQFPETKIGREIAKQLERQDLETRQALVAERERLTAAFEHRLPPARCGDQQGAEGSREDTSSVPGGRPGAPEGGLGSVRRGDDARP